MSRQITKPEPPRTVSKLPPMTKEQEKRFRERATQIDDRVAEMLRSMFATIDAERALTATRTKERDAALELIDAAVPECSWTDCKNKQTRLDHDAPVGRLCDEHSYGGQVTDVPWASKVRALLVIQGKSVVPAKEVKTAEPAPAAKE